MYLSILFCRRCSAVSSRIRSVVYRERVQCWWCLLVLLLVRKANLLTSSVPRTRQKARKGEEEEKIVRSFVRSFVFISLSCNRIVFFSLSHSLFLLAACIIIFFITLVRRVTLLDRNRVQSPPVFHDRVLFHTKRLTWPRKNLRNLIGSLVSFVTVKDLYRLINSKQQ